MELTAEQQEIVAEAARIENTWTNLEILQVQLRKDKRALRMKCKHDGPSTYHPDPSGNNDSGDTCDLCGAWI